MPKAKRASIGVALIARDAEGTIGQCLDSFRKHVEQIVVGVDALSTDDTPRVAKRHGADLIVPIQVSDWHECAQHGRILAQHFAEARNQSFAHLDPALPWWLWVDADDLVTNPERLADVCAQLEQANALGAWFPYDYGNVQGRVSTVFHRERLLRANVGWKWRYRVHEVVEPQSQTDGGWQVREDVRLFHQDHARSEPAAQRNLRLLEIDLEADPNDSRTLFYLGNQYFALQEWTAAAYWYERLLAVGQSPYEKWQSAVYLSMAYQRAGNLELGEAAAFRAISVMPQHAEPYYQLAVIARFRGDNDRCLYWTREARTGKEPPPFFVFKNPLDDSFNQRVVASDALAGLGRIGDARRELEEAYKALPDETVGNSIREYGNLERWSAYAQAYTTLAEPVPDPAKIALWEALDFPPEVRQFGRARDIVMPAYLRSRPNTQPRIVFWCGRGYEEWAPSSLNRTGIGGSETAVVEIAKRFAAAGWRTDVYNGAGRYEGVYDGVGYWEPERFEDQPTDVSVSWRQPNVYRTYGKNILWCHDLNYGPRAYEDLAGYDAVLGVSAWHAQMLNRYYDVATDYVPNGVDISRFPTESRRVGMQCVYTSSPDRGLDALLSLWPRIVEKEPGATLVVAYGFDNIDKLIAAGRGDLAQWKTHIQKMMQATPGVEFRGRLPQDDLARLFSESYAWLYPTQFLEVSCITAMEAMAGGCVPITSAFGALPETIGNSYGLTIPGMPWSRAWGDFFVQCVLGVLTQPSVRMPISMNGPKRAAELTWDRSFERWTSIMEGLLSGKTTAPERALVLA